ncbi:hypothetical protein [Paraglaciecola arctica]|uniref:hypothetical protein n=1 Tax=Paraglaciecola arctica TaxID=1128911 RepID=UPI001C06DB38|nr:hypothetical protein [Paraglaciecola arctica]MBU3005719.1 hypothetical protein [Paraglaciecola arctica]
MTQLNVQEKYIFLAVSLCTFTIWAAFFHQYPIMEMGGDFWEHAGALNSWMEDIMNPMSPHVASYESSARYMPFYFVIALIGSVLDLTSIQAMGLAASISVILLVIGIAYFSKSYFKDNRAPIYTLIILLCGWGLTWNWSNAYQLRNLVSIASYPSFFVFSFSFFVYGFIVKNIKLIGDKKTTVMLTIAISIAIAFSSHPLTGIFTVFFAGLLGIFYGESSIKNRLYILIAILVGSFLVELWPYFSTWALILGQTPDQSASWISSSSIEISNANQTVRWKKLIWGHPFYSPIQVLLTLLPVVLGVFLCLLFRPRKINIELLLAFSLMAFVYTFNLFFKIPLGHRALLLGMFPLHLLLVSWLLQISAGKNKKTYVRKLVSIYLSTILVFNIFLVVLELKGTKLLPTMEAKDYPFNRLNSIPEKLKPFTNLMDDTSIVMVKELQGWALPSVKGKVVSGMHTNPFIHDRIERRKNVKIFFNKQTSFEDKMKIIQKYDVTHILLRSDNEDSTIRKFNGVYSEFGDLTLITLKN